MKHSKPTSTPMYEFCIGGQLDQRMAEGFDGFTITPLPEGNTLITGAVMDQAALHGIISRIHDLGLPLISVKRKEMGSCHTD